MFSATQSITPLGDFSDSFNKSEIKRPRTIEAKPACWSQNLLAKLNSTQLLALMQSYYEYQGYTLNKTSEHPEQTISFFHRSDDNNQSLIVTCSSHQDTIDVADVKNFCSETKLSTATKSVFVTQSSFSSGALDFCANKPVTLISNREMLSLILKLNESDQKKLLAQATA